MRVTEGTLLGGKVLYNQSAAGHRSGFEPVLLAAAVPARAGQTILEAGCGAGAALLCLAHRVPGILGMGVEIVPELAALARENFNNNNLPDVFCVLADAARPPFGARFDHVMANPPWHDGASTNSPDGTRALAHHATPGLLGAWIAGLAACLRPRGTLTLILPAALLPEAAATLRAHRFGGARIFPLWPRAGQPAGQIIIAARLGAKTPDALLPGLILHDAGGITPEADAILRAGAALPMAG